MPSILLSSVDSSETSGCLASSLSTLPEQAHREKMAAAHKIAHGAVRGPSVVKETFYGLTLGLIAGGFWKMHHWNNQRRVREFYDLLEKGDISVVVEDE